VAQLPEVLSREEWLVWRGRDARTCRSPFIATHSLASLCAEMAERCSHLPNAGRGAKQCWRRRNATTSIAGASLPAGEQG
jgi:hypothetical protein